MDSIKKAEKLMCLVHDKRCDPQSQSKLWIFGGSTHRSRAIACRHTFDPWERQHYEETCNETKHGEHFAEAGKYGVRSRVLSSFII